MLSNSLCCCCFAVEIHVGAIHRIRMKCLNSNIHSKCHAIHFNGKSPPSTVSICVTTTMVSSSSRRAKKEFQKIETDFKSSSMWNGWDATWYCFKVGKQQKKKLLVVVSFGVESILLIATKYRENQSECEFDFVSFSISPSQVEPCKNTCWRVELQHESVVTQCTVSMQGSTQLPRRRRESVELLQTLFFPPSPRSKVQVLVTWSTRLFDARPQTR